MPPRDRPKFKQVALKIAARIAEESWTVEDLAARVRDQTDVSPEQVRRVVRGLKHPSPALLRVIASVLALDYSEMEQLLAADKIREKFGSIPAVICKKNPELQPLELVWPVLTQSQKENLLQMAEAFANLNSTGKSRRRRP